MKLTQWINRLTRIHSADELREFLVDLSRSFGAQHFWIMTVFAGECVSRSDIHAFTDYPDEFLEDYQRAGRIERDPVILNSMRNSNTVLTWSDLFDRNQLSDHHTEQLAWAKQYNICNGIAYPIIQSNYDFSLLHFVLQEDSASASRIIDTESLKQKIFCLGSLIHHKANEIIWCDKQAVSYKLSKREIECLLWASRGKTVDETAIILAISANTVRTHIQQILIKLSVTSKTAAVAKAIVTNQLNPIDIYYGNSSRPSP